MGIISAAEDTRETTDNTRANAVNPYSTTFTSTDTSSDSSPSEGTSTLSATTTQTIKVLIYNGEYSIGSCVSGIKKGLATANAKNLVPGYRFTYATSTIITSSRLAGYDVLAMPGGADGDYYVYSSSISSSAIKNFISSGHGYLGICAGAYSGVKSVKGYYKAWGIAPHVVSTRPWVEGNVGVKIEPAGAALFGYNGTITMAHYNGPAMFAYNGDIVTFATYADNKCHSKGLGAIVGDFYGKGRSVIVGPHPELTPTHSDILGYLVVWAANKSSLQKTLIPKATLSGIGTAATTLKTYYEKNKVLPGSVTVNGYNVSMPQFMYLLGRGILNISKGTTSNIALRPIGYPPAPSGKYKSGSISKTKYLSYVNSLVSFINSNGRVPNFQTTSLGKIPYQRLIYIYSKIMNYYNLNQKLPTSVTT